jgi:hypothetical protein
MDGFYLPTLKYGILDACASRFHPMGLRLKRIRLDPLSQISQGPDSCFNIHTPHERSEMTCEMSCLDRQGQVWIVLPNE